MLSEHFKRKEFECQCGCGYDTVDHELILVLEDLRVYFSRPIMINSGCRCMEYNQKVGGSANSLHIEGKAADIRVTGIHENAVADYLEFMYPDKYGIGRYRYRTHIDVRENKARWDKRGEK